MRRFILNKKKTGTLIINIKLTRSVINALKISQ